MNLVFYGLFIYFTYLQDNTTPREDAHKKTFSYAIIPKYVANFVLIFSVIMISCNVKMHAKYLYSVREVLVAIHSFLFFIQVTLQVVRYWLELQMDKETDAKSLSFFRLLKSYYIISATGHLVNILIMLLFFYMAIQFSGK